MTRSRCHLVLLALLAVAPGVVLAQGVPLGPEFQVNSYTTSFQFFPSVASDSAGNFVVAWLSSQGQDGSYGGIFAQRYASSGAPLGGEFRVNSYTTGQQYDPSVAADSAGNFVVAWSSFFQDGSSFGVFAQRYASSGAPLGAEFRVNTYTTDYQHFSSVAADPAGNFVVAWTRREGGYGGTPADVFGQRFASDGTPLGPEFRVNTYTTDSQAGPSVAADAAGNFVVAWTSYMQDGSSSGAFAQRYASTGAPLGGEFRVNTYTTSGQGGPRVASDSAGNFVVIWGSNSQDGQGYGIFGQRFSSTGVPLGSEFRVNTYTTSDQEVSSIASDSAGDFVVAWSSITQDGSDLGVFAQRYASTGDPVGGEFRVNTYTTSYQRVPSVASDAAGNFVVAWNSELQDGSAYGVFAQRYSMIVPVELLGFRVE